MINDVMSVCFGTKRSDCMQVEPFEKERVNLLVKTIFHNINSTIFNAKSFSNSASRERNNKKK